MFPGGGGASGGRAVSASASFDLPVELYGIVYIYNPDKLGIDRLGIDLKEAEETEEAPATEAAAQEGETQPEDVAATAPGGTDLGAD